MWMKVVVITSLLVLFGCSASPRARRSVPLDCSINAVDCKILEFNCRRDGGTWDGRQCR